MEWSPIISFKELDIELCNAENGRKMKRPIFNKLCYETIPVFYKDNKIFRKIYNSRKETKKYYSMEEIQELYINYILDNNIKLTGEVKGIIEKW